MIGATNNTQRVAVPTHSRDPQKGSRVTLTDGPLKREDGSALRKLVMKSQAERIANQAQKAIRERDAAQKASTRPSPAAATNANEDGDSLEAEILNTSGGKLENIRQQLLEAQQKAQEERRKREGAHTPAPRQAWTSNS